MLFRSGETAIVAGNRAVDHRLLLREVPRNGHVLLCTEHPRALALKEHAFSTVQTYGFAPTADWRIEALSSSSAGETFRDCDECPLMARLPAGRFDMGVAPGEEAREQLASVFQHRSEPRRSVTVAEFAIGRHEVTRGEYRAFVRATGHAGAGCFAWTRWGLARRSASVRPRCWMRAIRSFPSVATWTALAARTCSWWCSRRAAATRASCRRARR